VRLPHRPVPKRQAGPRHHSEHQVASVRSAPSTSSSTTAFSTMPASAGSSKTPWRTAITGSTHPDGMAPRLPGGGGAAQLTSKRPPSTRALLEPHLDFRMRLFLRLRHQRLFVGAGTFKTKSVGNASPCGSKDGPATENVMFGIHGGLQECDQLQVNVMARH